MGQVCVDRAGRGNVCTSHGTPGTHITFIGQPRVGVPCLCGPPGWGSSTGSLKLGDTPEGVAREQFLPYMWSEQEYCTFTTESQRLPWFLTNLSRFKWSASTAYNSPLSPQNKSGSWYSALAKNKTRAFCAFSNATRTDKLLQKPPFIWKHF